VCYYCNVVESGKFRVKLLDVRAQAPSKRQEDSGYDVYGIIEDDFILLSPGQNVIISTGLSMEIPLGVGFILSNRSSVGTKCAIVGAEVIDSGFRGEVKIDLHNISDRNIFLTDITDMAELGRVLVVRLTKILGEYHATGAAGQLLKEKPLLIPKSKALVQGLLIPTYHLPVEIVKELGPSERMIDAFGSTNRLR
jgi:dUTPase